MAMQSLGYADVSLTMVNTGHGARPQLMYLRGSACPQDPNTKLSTTIEFSCDKTAGRVSFYSRRAIKFDEKNYLFLFRSHFFWSYSIQGTPVLEEILHDCHHIFRWPTNVICPTEKQQFMSGSCEIFTSELDAKTDLRTIFKDGKANVSWLNWVISLEISMNGIALIRCWHSKHFNNMCIIIWQWTPFNSNGSSQKSARFERTVCYIERACTIELEELNLYVHFDYFEWHAIYRIEFAMNTSMLSMHSHLTGGLQEHNGDHRLLRPIQSTHRWEWLFPRHRQSVHRRQSTMRSRR